jgi:plasmid maintenance system killer protein
MIGTFRDSYLARFYWDDQPDKKIPADLQNRLYRRLIFQWDDARSMVLNIYLDNHSYR